MFIPSFLLCVVLGLLLPQFKEAAFSKSVLWANCNFILSLHLFSYVFALFFYSKGPLNPLLGCVCTSKHADTILKVMFFSHWQRPSKNLMGNGVGGVPWKDSTATLQQHQHNQLKQQPNWLMFYIKQAFIPFKLHFQGQSGRTKMGDLSCVPILFSEMQKNIIICDEWHFCWVLNLLCHCGM